jgi:hypothetical protein
VGKGGASCAAAAGRNGTSREAERGAVHFEERGEAAGAPRHQVPTGAVRQRPRGGPPLPRLGTGVSARERGAELGLGRLRGQARNGGGGPSRRRK